ncbi:hypothetical protein GCM10009867_25760 [Pedococcus aerophilus]|uniref:ANTAR domain-containing protein n=1 Tax=Pedococcus aerophilus TaxID=436356 RepID=A0ABN3UTB7_9MICO
MPFEAVDNLGPSLMFDYLVNTDTWTCSEGIRALYGVAEGQPVKTAHMLARIVAEDRDTIFGMFQRTLQTPGPFSCEFRICDPRGTIHHVVLAGESRAAPGQVERVQGFMVDITNSVRQGAAEAVEASAEHRAVIEQAKGAIMATFGMNEAAAFAVLQRFSQNHNIKLRDLAARVVSDGVCGSEDDVTRIRQMFSGTPA